jgi:hypothetical protein
MILKAARWALVCACLAWAAPSHAQTGHPAKGSWLGYWGPSEEEQRRVLLLLDWENREVAGVINPGPRAVPIARADVDYDTWTMTLEADMPTADGEVARWTAVGKLENLGSWTNRRYSGSYTHGAETGTFSVTLN